MKKNTIEAYIEAIRVQYEKAIEGPNSSFLVKPSPAQLRDLCIALLKEKKNKDDYAAFKDFWNFEFKSDELRSIFNKIELPRLVPICRFFKGESTPSDWITIEMAALLVELPERPYNKFKNLDLKQDNTSQNEVIQKVSLELEEAQKIDSDSEDSASANNDPIDPSTGIIPEPLTDIVDQGKREKETPAETETKEVIDNPENKPPDSEYDDTKPMGFLTYPPATTVHKIPPRPNKMYIIIGSILVMVILVWGLNKTVFTPKNCMIWMEDHYEKIDCSDPEIQVYRIPLNDKLLEKFRKVAYSDTLTFFDPYGKPLIWYSKLNGQYELFTYHGLHPVTEKTLKPITHTIVNNITNNPNR